MQLDVDLLVATPEGVLAKDEAFVETHVDATMVDGNDCWLGFVRMDEAAVEPKRRELLFERIVCGGILVSFFPKPEPVGELGFFIHFQNRHAAAFERLDSVVEEGEGFFDCRGEWVEVSEDRFDFRVSGT